MVKRLRVSSANTACCLLVAAAAACAPPARAQASFAFPDSQNHTGKEHGLPDRLPEKPTVPPSFSIPVEPLGFSPPGPIYLGQRNTLVSLDFLDDNRLLFTFRVPGLMHRDAAESGFNDERRIRAVVLSLPAGVVTAEALWTVHDRVRYLWMLKDGSFLLRDRDGIQKGNAALELKPLLNFPGPLLWMEMDPSQQYLVTNSHEPASTVEKPGDVPSPATAHADLTVEGQKPSVPDTVVRILQRDSGQVMLVSRARAAVHLPINSEGYVEALRGNADQWMLNLNFFTGGTRVLGRVNSVCPPTLNFVSQRELLAGTCDSAGGHRTVALGADGHRLWDDANSSQAVWPLFVMAPDGSRVARETLVVNHEINAYSPIDAEDIKGQLVRVFDAANGRIELETAARPPFDAGGNVAISPTGRRLAVLNDGAIQVFDLPAASPPAPDSRAQAAH